MKNRIYNHKRNILARQPSIQKSLLPGMFVTFRYSTKNVSDPNPIVLVLHNDFKESKVHGINLNYMSDYLIKQIMEDLTDGAGVYSEDENVIIMEDQDSPLDTDNSMPYRNMLTEPYTRIKLPTYMESREGNPLSRSEAIKQMDILYEKKLKKIVKKKNIYRTYFAKKMSALQVVEYNIQGLLK